MEHFSPDFKADIISLMKKVVFISGGSDGLGKEIARTLSPTCSVVIFSPTKEKLEKVAKELGCDFLVGDVSVYEDNTRGINEVVKKYGRVDCLVNNAGLWIEGELDANDPAQIEKVIKVNSLGVILLTKAVIPQMKKQKSGLIININSQSGFYANKPGRSVYNATKWGITGFTKSLQPELAKYGIRVTGIYPGKMKTKLFEKAGIQKEMSDALEPKVVAEFIEFLLATKETTVFPEVGIKLINS